jgi:hypothetical protein
MRTATAFVIGLGIWVTIAVGMGLGACVLWAHWDAFLDRRKQND